MAGVVNGSLESNHAVQGARRRTLWITAIGTTAVALALLVPSTSGKGAEMDEGAVLAYAVRVLDGGVPHRDFLTFYGPGNPWLVAGAFEIFGTSIATERAVGLLYLMVVVLSLFALALRLGGLLAGALAGILAAKIMAHDLVWAYATYGAMAFGLLGLALAMFGAASRPGRRQTLFFLGAGAAGGVAILMRLDFAPTIVVSALPLLAFVPARSRNRYGAGLLPVAAAYMVHVAIVGPEKVERTLRDLLASGPGRSLPLPEPWAYPGSLLTAAILATALLVVLGIVRWRRRPHDLVARVLLSAGLFSAGMIPWTFSRVDEFHIRPFALVSLSLLPAVALLLARTIRLSPRGRGAFTVCIAVISLSPFLSDGKNDVHRALDLREIRSAYRGFYDDDRASASGVVAQTRRLAQPGDSLFVGPQDLRRTNYGPTYVYYLLPHLRPASYYMEMNPGTANRVGSGLADDLRGADWLILTSEWDRWNEPNESSKLGPSEPNDVVRDVFCVRFERGQYRLYERCDRA